jgi:hypothetical protein
MGFETHRTWAHARQDAAGAPAHGAATPTAPRNDATATTGAAVAISWTPSWGWAQKTFAPSQSEA